MGQIVDRFSYTDHSWVTSFFAHPGGFMRLSKSELGHMAIADIVRTFCSQRSLSVIPVRAVTSCWIPAYAGMKTLS